MISADRRSRRRGLRPLLVLLAALATAIPAGALTAAPALAVGTTPPNTGTIAPGVHVGNIDLSGMDEATARQTLTAAFAPIGQGQVLVAADSKTTTITYQQINRHVDIDALITAAFQVGRDGTAMQRIVAVFQTAATGTNLTPTVVFDQSLLESAMANTVNSSNVVYTNAKVILKDGAFTTTPSAPGRRFDSSQVLPSLETQLTDINAPSQIAVGLTGSDWPANISDAEAATAAQQATTISAPLILANGGQKWPIPTATVQTWFKFVGVNGILVPTPVELTIQKTLTALAPQINRAAVSASWQFGPNGVIVVPAKAGRTMNIPATAHNIANVLNGRLAGTWALDKLVGPVVTTTQPAVSTAEAAKQSSKFKAIGTWTTYFQPASHNGFGANIWVPAGYLDNQVVDPGQTFSFWGRVGPVTQARGYKLGGAIVNGHTEEGVAIGGGICSTSTTLFNAALRAGLQMGERSNHYYYITRYPVGLDATVSKSSGGGQQDMTWTNDTPYPILIKSFKTGGSVTFTLYGIPTGRTVNISKPTIWGYTKATQVVIPVNTLPTGRLVRIEYPDDGFSSSVTVTVTDSHGKQISNRTYISHYGTVQGVQYIGSPTGQPLQVPSYAPGAQGG
jgi:vancomycin resistance protein YoaR